MKKNLFLVGVILTMITSTTDATTVSETLALDNSSDTNISKDTFEISEEKEDEQKPNTENSLPNIKEQLSSLKKDLPENPDKEELLSFSDYFSSPTSNNPSDTFFSQDGKILTLSSQEGTAGSIWSKQKIDLTKSFKLQAYMYFGNKISNKNTVADGVFFGLQNKKEDYLGGSGGALGMYPESPTFPEQYGLGWEFDTYNNGDYWDYDQTDTANHVAFIDKIWSEVPSTTEHKENVFLEYGKLANGNWKLFTLDWNVNGDSLTMLWTLSEVKSKGSYEELLVKSINTSLQGTLDKQFQGETSAWWGFTSSIGDVAIDSYHAVSFSGLPVPTFEVYDRIDKNVGDSWLPYEGFIRATDGYGNDIPKEHIDEDRSKLKLNTPGIYTVTYSYGGFSGNTKVYVKDNPKINLNEESVNLYKGDEFDPFKYFESAIGSYGDNITYNEIKVDNPVDMEQVGEYRVIYSFVDKNTGEQAKAELEVNVKEFPIIQLFVPETINFGEYTLATGPKILNTWQDDHTKVEITDYRESKTPFVLTVKMSGDLARYAYYNENALQESAEVMITSEDDTYYNVSHDWKDKNGVYLKFDNQTNLTPKQYSGILEWNITSDEVYE